MLKKVFLSVAIIFGSFSPIQTQINLSAYSEISVVTAGPGSELYEAFGHSAIRIKDPVLNFDIIYNYGMFDFNQPNFILNFTKGKLLYKLARYNFNFFLSSYNNDSRWVKQQVLNLSLQERQELFIYLENNASPKNASYLYDPFFNNCATKLRDVLQTVLHNNVEFGTSHVQKNVTLRTLMNREIYWNTWGSVGINLALGSKLDKIASPNEYQYLPKYVFTTFGNATIKTGNELKKLIKKEEVLLNFPTPKPQIAIANPLLVCCILAFIVIFISYKNYQHKNRTRWLDFLLFFSTGIVGCLLVFLWFFTDHSTTPDNYNLLWAFAPNSIIAFYLLKNKKRKWLHKYITLALILICLAPVVWILKIQELPIACNPILLLLVVRYLYLLKELKKY